jgi:transcriptional regulator GlxA family with amidase domain
VAVVAFDDVVLADLATPLELFGLARDARGLPAYEVRVCSRQSRVRAGQLSIEVRHRLAALRRARTVIVPGVRRPGRAPDGALLAALQAAVARGARVASVCTGAFVLAAAGVLDGLRATTHWRAATELARRHPGVQIDPDVLYTDNGQVLTSAGAAAAFDLCLHMLRCDLGAELAAAVAREAVMPLERAGGQAQFIVHAPPAADGGSLGPLLEWVEQNLKRDLSLAVLARRAHASTRTLSRNFKRQVGVTPAQWVSAARVRRAQRLLETTDLSIERVACEVGFRSASALRERFAGSLGTSPQAYRRSFRSA